jgi:hypothetical protein
MRKKLRMLLLALTIVVVPAANAIDYMNCAPGTFKYYPQRGWWCEYDPDGTHCIVCYAMITVTG